MHQIEALAIKEPLVTASMLSLIAETDNGLGRSEQGLVANARELELLHGDGGRMLDIADALSVRGELLEEGGHYRDAEGPLREAIALVEHERGAERHLADAVVELGRVLANTGREAEGESELKRAIDIYKRIGDLKSTAAPLSNLSVLYGNEGHYAESAASIRKAIEIQQKSLPPDHPDLLLSEYNYAGALENNHQFAEAEPVFRQLIAARLRVLGPDNQFTLLAEQGLADDLYELHRYSESAATALPAAQGLTRAVGENHPYTMAAWAMYGIAACLDGQGEAGLAALSRVEGLRRTLYGADNWRTFSTQLNIGTCLLAMRRDAEAEPMLLQAVAGLEGARGASFHRTQAGYQTLRDLYARTGRAAESTKWQAKIIAAGR
jgi:tetratricopeptide (TPR) repeat protein